MSSSTLHAASPRASTIDDSKSRNRSSSRQASWDGRAFSWDMATLRPCRLPLWRRLRHRLNLDAMTTPRSVGWCLRVPLLTVLQLLESGAAWIGTQRGGDEHPRLPAEVLYTPDVVLVSPPGVGGGEAAGQLEGQALPARQRQQDCFLVPAFVDPWTLEITPASLEEAYALRHHQAWLSWHGVDKAVVFVLTAVAASSWSGEGAQGYPLIALLWACGAASAAAAAAALLPRRFPAVNMPCMLLATELLLLMCMAVGFLGQQLSAPHRLCAELELQQLLRVPAAVLALWLSRLWMLLSLLHKHMVLLLLADAAMAGSSLALAGAGAAFPLELVRLAALSVAAVAVFRGERIKRRRFLASLSALQCIAAHDAAAPAVDTATQSCLAEAPNPAAGSRAPAGTAAGGHYNAARMSQSLAQASIFSPAKPLKSARSDAVKGGAEGVRMRSLLHSTAMKAAAQQDVALHFNLLDMQPDEIPPEFGGQLRAALRQQGFECCDSYMTSGSVRLMVLLQCVQGQPAQPLDVRQLVRQLQASPPLKQLLQRPGTLQVGRNLVSCSCNCRCSLCSGAVAVPELLQAPACLLQSAQPVPLVLRVRLPRCSSHPAPLALHIRSSAGCQTLPLKSVSSSSCAELLRIQTVVKLTCSRVIEVVLLEVNARGVSSLLVPMAVSSSPDLVGELTQLSEQCSDHDGGGIPWIDVLWWMRNVLRLASLVDVRPSTRLNSACERGCGCGDALCRKRVSLQQLAARVRQSSPPLLRMVASLQLPTLLKLLLRDTAVAFLPALRLHGNDPGDSGMPTSCAHARPAWECRNKLRVAAPGLCCHC